MYIQTHDHMWYGALDRCTRTTTSSLNFSPFSTDINWAMTSPKPNRTKRCVCVHDCYQPHPLPFIANLLMWYSWWSQAISPAACCTTQADWTVAWARRLQRASGRFAATPLGTSWLPLAVNNHGHYQGVRQVCEHYYWEDYNTYNRFSAQCIPKYWYNVQWNFPFWRECYCDRTICILMLLIEGLKIH